MEDSDPVGRRVGRLRLPARIPRGVPGKVVAAVVPAVSLLITLVLLPQQSDFVFGGDTVDGVIVSEVTRSGSGSTPKYHALVQYSTRGGLTYSASLSVGRDDRRGDQFEVRYIRADPEEAVPNHAYDVYGGFVVSVLLGPLVLVGYLGWGIRSLWRRRRNSDRTIN